jgi:NitT/TauT family transport system substrate-binding protein
MTMITLLENFRAVFYAPYYAAEALGAYRAEGLDVRMKMSPAAQTTLVSLNAGAGDVSWGGPLRIMSALDKDPAGGYVAFCEVVCRDPFYLLGCTPNPGFKLGNLMGKRLATVSEVPTPWICLQQDLHTAGIDPASITRTAERTMTENVAALKAGEADVIQVFQPFAQHLIDEAAGHVWYAAASRGLTSYTTFNTTRAFIDKYPDTAHGMTRAMYRTQKWIAAHDGRDLAEVLASYLPDIQINTLAACCNDYKRMGLWNHDPRVHRAGIEWLRDAMLASGHIRTRFSYEQCVDNRFAEQVVSEDPASI